jgi:hypothetical protein
MIQIAVRGVAISARRGREHPEGDAEWGFPGAETNGGEAER